MKLTIKIIQPGKRERLIETTVKDDSFTIQNMRSLLEAEHALNSLPTPLRFHVELVRD